MKLYTLGHYNTLRIKEFCEHGILLDAGDGETILMPRKYVEDHLRLGDEVKVFIYLDQEDRLVATTEQALAEVGEFAFLRVSWTNRYGAFLNWGLTKDLFVPFREQRRRMVKDAAYMVYIYIDERTRRIVATTRLDGYVQMEAEGYHAGQEVSIQIWKPTDIGYKVIVDGRYGGLVYRNEVFRLVHVGDKMKAIVKNVRPDGRLDIALQKSGAALVEDFSQQLLKALQEAQEHFLPFTDKSPSDEIITQFSVSKKTFKKAVGALYKHHLIVLEEEGIRLV